MSRTKLVLTLVAVVCLTVGCRMIETLTGGESAGTVNSLWEDVPPIEGATKSNLAFPLGARLLIRAAMQGKLSFIAYTTDKSAQEVQSFYSIERMKTAGWADSNKGCMTDTDEKQKNGSLCFFSRKDGNKREGLAIVIAQDAKTSQTDIFYARIDLTETATPSP